MNQLQQRVGETFQVFGTTPLTVRLEDIANEHTELQRYTTLSNLREETGDMLSALIQLCNESGWNYEELIGENLDKINRRKDQYSTLGRKARVGILGGAFDPPHAGHLALAQTVLLAMKLDEVWLAPCYGHLGGKDMTPADHRANMVKLACANDPRVKPFLYEMIHKLGGETYHFVNRIKNDPAFENFQFYFIIAQDNADTFKTWYKSEELEKLVPFIVCQREGYVRDETVDWYMKPPHRYMIGEKLPSTSSTEIRVEFKIGKRSHEHLDPKVLEYILQHHLYGT